VRVVVVVLRTVTLYSRDIRFVPHVDGDRKPSTQRGL
jgi:hypothetical protein